MPWLAVLQQTKGPPRLHSVLSAHFAHEGTEAESAGVGFWGARQRCLWKCTLAPSRAADGRRGFGGGLGLSFRKCEGAPGQELLSHTLTGVWGQWQAGQAGLEGISGLWHGLISQGSRRLGWAPYLLPARPGLDWSVR